MRLLRIAAVVLAGAFLSGCLKSNLPELGDVPAFELTGEDGSAFRSAEELAGKVWVADFIFTTCNGPCPRMSTHMQRLQEMTAEMTDVQMVSVTIDPKTDTPEVLAAYARRYKHDPARWHFLTGRPADLQALGKDAFHLGDVNVDHSARFALVDRKMRIRGYYELADSGALKQLVADIASLRREVL
ncbi:MAG: SCO family protein [Candidatus Solibacter usitatus]|nr:SCO family protein [Candidatus Solibacter usitatus]